MRRRTNASSAIRLFLAALVSIGTVTFAGLGVQANAQTTPTLTGQAAFTDWNQQKPGVRHRITVADLPERGVSPEPLPDEGLWGEVRRLPPKQRTALALRYVADAGYGEISAVMGTSEEAARRSVHEALKRLRTEYES